MSTITEKQRKDARDHIQKLRCEREYPQEILEELELTNGRSVGQLRKYIEFNNRHAQSFVRVISEDIYTSAGGVIFELIQNADDASYSHPFVPYITFILHQDKIIIECNEDGFNPSNVEAICSVGNSDKDENSTGEKGLGFKSVFMIASKVHIESAGYSFSFTYKKGDRESQQYTPKYEEPHYPDDGLTRITLFLVDDETKRREALQKFEEVPATLLLFLRKIKKLVIINDIENGGPKSTIHTCQEESTQREVLTKTVTHADGRTFTFRKHFHITTHSVTGLWTNEKRKSKTSKIKLAFPLTPKNCPLIEKQPNIFAHLPIGSEGVGFYFLIQSDFATTANREALVTTSLRNIALRDKIAEAFRDAVLEFSKNPSLQFCWLNYLPDDSVSDEFWTVLRSSIKKILWETPFLLSPSGRLNLIRNLRIVPRSHKYPDGNPIFSDLPLREKYANRGYEAQTEKLRTLGLEELSNEDLMDRAERDINPANSRMKLITADDEWHTQAAKSLKSLLPEARSRIMALELIPIIPLGNLKWTSAAAENLYLPHVNNIPIPTDLGMKLVHPEALQNPARKQLFKVLCIDDAPSNIIRQAVFEKYQFRPFNINLNSSIAHLRYLWWTHTDQNNDTTLATQLFVYNQNDEPICPKGKEKNIFFDADDRYGIRTLLSDKRLLLHQDYLQLPSPKDREGHPSWCNWLSDFIGVQNYPPLVSRDDPSKLSSIFMTVAKDRPEMIVGLLNAHQGEYRKSVKGNKDIQSQIANIEVSCETAEGKLFQKRLCITHLGVPTLQNICKSFSVDKVFPFLKLPVAITESDHSKWNFLLLFGVKSEADIPFYLYILSGYIKHVQNHVLDQVFDLYDRLFFLCIQDVHHREERQKLICKFSGKQKIFHPTSGIDSFVWSEPEKCLWDAPSYMQSKVPLAARYLSVHNVSIPARFFQEILEIKNATWEDLVNELEFLRDLRDEVCFENIKDIYLRLNSMRVESPSIGFKILERFENSKLVFLRSQKSWKAPSACLWSSKAEITGRNIVSKQFDRCQQKNDLRAFFFDCLKVTEPSLKMLVEELKTVAKPLVGRSFSVKDTGSIEIIKALITAINSMPLDQAVLMETKLQSESIFPARLKNMKMLKSTADYFSITDRQKYQEAFKNEAWILDFSLEEVLELKPFLQWLGLEERYLSRRVTERSTFGGNNETCSHDLTQDLRFRAKSLFRCAVHFGSQTTRAKNLSLLRLLSKVTVYQSDDIVSSLELSQIADSKANSVYVSSTKSKLHINRAYNEKLQIYVPRDDRQRLLCYLKILPEKMVSDIFNQLPNSLVSPTGPNIVRVLATILNVPLVQEMLDELLEDFGIGKLPEYLEKQIESGDEANLETKSLGFGDNSDGESASHYSDNSTTSTALSSTSHLSTDSPLSTLSTNSARNDSNSSLLSSASSQNSSAASIPRGQLSQIISSTHPQPVPSPVTNRTSNPQLDVSHQEQFKRLLDKVINAAKEVNIPTNGAFNMNSLQKEIISIMDSNDDDGVSNISYTSAFGDRSTNQLRHDMKIGVAGELFVYEILSNLHHGAPQHGLFDFGPNWCSSIRDLVRVHPGCEERFKPVKNPSRREEADIIYQDTKGVLTQFLLDKLYLKPSNRWKDARPKYYIEVKTTTKDCSTKFYMSRSQYQRMRDITSSQSSPVEEVYLIFRVYWLTEKDIGLRIYANPDELEFREESYSVTPAARA